MAELAAFLGARALGGGLGGRHCGRVIIAARDGARLPPLVALRQGVLSNLGNPKMLAFFTSLLPQFAGSFAGLLALGLVFCTMTLVWLTAYSVVVARAGAVFRRERVRRAVEAVTGTVLIALRLRLAPEDRRRSP